MQGDKSNANISMDKKLLFTIWLLSKPESFLAVGDRFDIPTSTGHGIFKSIICALAELMPQYIQWPDAARRVISSQVRISICVLYKFNFRTYSITFIHITDFCRTFTRHSKCCGSN